MRSLVGHDSANPVRVSRREASWHDFSRAEPGLKEAGLQPLKDVSSKIDINSRKLEEISGRARLSQSGTRLKARSVRARLQSCRTRSQGKRGFSPGRTLSKQEASGHDFSRAEPDLKEAGLQPRGRSPNHDEF